MNVDTFIYLFVGLMIFSAVAGVIRFIMFIVASKRMVEQAGRTYQQFGQGLGGMGYNSSFGNQDLSVMLSQIESIIQSANVEDMSDYDRNQMQLMMGQAMNQYSQMNQLSQQKYDTQISGLMGYAASNGLDWHP